MGGEGLEAELDRNEFPQRMRIIMVVDFPKLYLEQEIGTLSGEKQKKNHPYFAVCGRCCEIEAGCVPLQAELRCGYRHIDRAACGLLAS